MMTGQNAAADLAEVDGHPRGRPQDRAASVLALQSAAGNRAVTRAIARAELPAVQRFVVTSYIMGSDPKAAQPYYWEGDDTGSEAPKQLPGLKGTETYRAAAEAKFGSLPALNHLAVRGVLRMPPVAGRMRPAYDRSHLVAGSFLGEKKYPDAASNVRFFPDHFEDGAWQRGESAVEKQLHEPDREWSGRVEVNVSEGSRTGGLIAEDVAQLADLSGPEKNSLAGKITAAQAVPAAATMTLAPTGGSPRELASANQLDGYLTVNPECTKENARLVLAEEQIGVLAREGGVSTENRFATEADFRRHVEALITGSKLDEKDKQKARDQKLGALDNMSGKVSAERLQNFVRGLYKTLYGPAIAAPDYGFGWLS